MSEAIIHPGVLSGAMTVPASKSAVHRAVICAALSRGVSRLRGVTWSADISATLGAVGELGAKVIQDGDGLLIDGTEIGQVNQCDIDCGESGSTLRFLIPIAAALGVSATFTGQGRLPHRPQQPYEQALSVHGVCVKRREGSFLPLQLSGALQCGKYRLAGDVSSQFVSGLLFALPLLSGDSEIEIIGPLESAGYVDMTIETLAQFGVSVKPTPTGFFVPGGQTYQPTDCTMEGDWSQAAFFLVAGALGGDVLCKGLNPNSSQRDRRIVDILNAMGANVTVTQAGVRAQVGDGLWATDMEVRDIPDLVPALAVAAAFAQGTTHITAAARLRFKESDRLCAVADGLLRLGVSVEEQEDGLVITGKNSVHAAALSGYGDHRIVMALAIAAAKLSEGNLIISDAQSIDKSYPAFFEHYNSLGGMAHVV